MKNQKNSLKGIIGTLLLFGLVFITYKGIMTPTVGDAPPLNDCRNTVSFLFDIDDISVADLKKQVVTINVPINSSITYGDLRSEVECYAKRVYKEKKADVVWVNIFWSKEKYKTFKGTIQEGTIKYENSKFEYLTFTKDTFRKYVK